MTAGESNEGISAFVGNKINIFNENTITIDMFGSAKYRNYKYGADDHIAVIHTDKIPKSAVIFLTSAIHKVSNAGQFDYGRNFYAKDADKLKISLPSKGGEPYFDFMKSFIDELERENITEIEGYLKVSGLSDYELKDEEINALSQFEKGHVKWKEFSLDDLFQVNTSKKRFDANKITVNEKEGFPYIVRQSINNGVKGFILENKSYLNQGNTISFGQDTATMYYQETPYFTGDKIKILVPKFSEFKRNNAQFFIASMIRTFSSFSWGNSSFSEKVIKNQKVKLPIKKSGRIDFKFIELVISGIQKTVIKDVVLYTNKLN
ncbi:Putative type II restriction enzyme [Moritella viscosa]|nr:Putative type II restriction enzyme [Moritella viscosa]